MIMRDFDNPIFGKGMQVIFTLKDIRIGIRHTFTRGVIINYESGIAVTRKGWMIEINVPFIHVLLFGDFPETDEEHSISSSLPINSKE